MHAQTLTWKRLTIVSTTVMFLALLALGLVAQLAAHGGGDGLIHACVNDNSGEIKIVGPDDECKKNWSPLDWNVRGVPGLACWDLNGNGLPDPAEDTNGDLVVDVLDCRGGTAPPPPSPPPPPPPPLDHFLCYATAQNGSIHDPSVILTDQFITDATATVLGGPFSPPVMFCNPTDKVHNGEVTLRKDNSGHLMLHPLTVEVEREKFRVEVRNQFGTAILEVQSPPYALGVPTEKQFVDFEPTLLPAPTKLSHFTCYAAQFGNFPNEVVDLTDQFRDHTVTVLVPRILCNPTTKFHADRQVDPTNEIDHLVCYIIRASETELPHQVQAVNQFGGASVITGTPGWLCVPSEKTLLGPSP